MKIELYQIDPARDENEVRYRGFDDLPALQGSPRPDPTLYRKVFEGEFPDRWDLEDLFGAFNRDGNPSLSEYRMTVSDVVRVTGASELPDACYYCDSFGWREVAFDCSLTSETELNVVYCEPGEPARCARIGAELPDLQKAVGGFIEFCFPFEPEPGGEEVCILCNEEGKLIPGMQPCRSIRSRDGEIRDIVYGPFLLCSVSGENLRSLSPETQEKYRKLFELPERFDARGMPVQLQAGIRKEAPDACR